MTRGSSDNFERRLSKRNFLLAIIVGILLPLSVTSLSIASKYGGMQNQLEVVTIQNADLIGHVGELKEVVSMVVVNQNILVDQQEDLIIATRQNADNLIALETTLTVSALPRLERVEDKVFE